MAINVTISKDFGIGKAQAMAKARMTEVIMNALKAEFGEEETRMVRTGGFSNKVNEIGVKMGTITEDGFEYDFVCTVNPIIKGHKDRKVGRNLVEGTVFDTIVEEYENWVKENEEKAKIKAENKAKKIAADKKAREAKAKAKNSENDGE